ncbi:MAG: molybdenum cofactor guanylyltransferase [Xanthomonadales bacterium]|nr:molybdenum cofactor guanylyltransferase [Xanthomonadales bacterium]
MAGGSSRRMGRNKALLRVGSTSLLDRAAGLLSEVCDGVLVSLAAASDFSIAGQWDVLTDLREDVGPMAGLEAAFSVDPRCAWLLLAVDMPGVDRIVLQALLDERVPGKAATAFWTDGRPQPLCAVYEPVVVEPLQQVLAAKHYSLSRLLLQLDARFLETADPRLVNVNTPDQWQDLGRPDSPGGSVPLAYQIRPG